MEISKERFLNIIKKVSISFKGIVVLLVAAFSIIHLVLLGIFFAAGMKVMVLTNIIAVFLYPILGIVCVKKKYYFRFLLIVYLVIQGHSLFSCIYLGWTYGFSLYCMCAMPVSFFMFYLCEKEKINLKFVLNLNLVTLIGILLARAWVYIKGPWVKTSQKWATAISSYNMFICGLVVIAFSGLFVYQLCYTDKELKKQTERLDFMANYDALTKLRNRRSLKTILEKEVQSREKSVQTPLCVALGDIDDFKGINDVYGHDCGDMVLASLGALFLEKVQGENYVARWGGEEMLFVFQMPFEDSKKLLEEIRSTIEAKIFVYDEKEFQTSMTFGLTEYKGNVSLDELLIKVDMLMYHGKRSGKNRIVV